MPENVGSGDAAYHNAALKGLGATGNVKGSSGVLHAAELHNLDAADAYLQVFDAVSNASVTLGVTVPNFSIHVGSSATAQADKTEPDLEYGFNLGLVVAVTTTDGGSSSPATGLTVDLTYS